MAEEDRTAEEDLAQTVVRGDRNGGRGGNGYRGGNPSGRLDREIDRMNKGDRSIHRGTARQKESREREKDRNKNDRQRNDYDALGGKKQERFVKSGEERRQKKPNQQPQPKQEEDVIKDTRSAGEADDQRALPIR